MPGYGRGAVFPMFYFLKLFQLAICPVTEMIGAFYRSKKAFDCCIGRATVRKRAEENRSFE
jgi:hypothetical protein